MGFDKRNGVLALLVVLSVVSVTGAGTAAVAASAEQCSFPVTKTDATGTEVTVDEEPKRVVTLSPSAAQTMWEIGAKDKVVGVTKYADYLEGAEKKTNISGSGYTTVVVEKVVALKPDLVLAPNVVSNSTVEKLRNAGLTVYKFREAKSIEDVKEKTALTGRLVGACEGAEQTVAWMERELAVIREAVEGQERPNVLYTFYGYTAGKGTFIHKMIRAAGGRNVAAQHNITGYARISQEVIANASVDWIIRNSGNPEVPNTKVYNQTRAVQEGNVLVLNTDYLNQPAPRIIVTIRKMVKAFHPKAYEQALATPTPTATPTGTETPAGGSPTASTPVYDSSPGFGLVVGLVALALVGLLTRRD